MFLPMIDLPAVEYVALAQPACEKEFKYKVEDRSKQFPSGPGRNDGCARNCCVVSISGRPCTEENLGYWGKFPFTWYDVCLRCSVPRGRG